MAIAIHRQIEILEYFRDQWDNYSDPFQTHNLTRDELFWLLNILIGSVNYRILSLKASLL